MVGLAGNDSVHQRENSPREAGGGEGEGGEGETLSGEGARDKDQSSEETSGGDKNRKPSGRGGRHLAEEEEN